MMRRVHLDTDRGGDIDDLCALAMRLSWQDDAPRFNGFWLNIIAKR